MIKELLNPIPVVVGPDRVKNSGRAIREFSVDTVILDDGFQHWRIKRDLDIVLIDSSNPFGNGHLFPRGILREAPHALKRADIILLTKTDLGKNNIDKIKENLSRIAPELPICESVYNPKYLYKIGNKQRLDLTYLRGKAILALSSIVNPDYFEFILKNLGTDIKIQFHYPDHHRYDEKDLEHIIYESKKHNIDTIVTTEKDAVKLRNPSWARNDINIFVLHIEPEITKGEEAIDRRLASLYSS